MSSQDRQEIYLQSNTFFSEPIITNQTTPDLADAEMSPEMNLKYKTSRVETQLRQMDTCQKYTFISVRGNRADEDSTRTRTRPRTRAAPRSSGATLERTGASWTHHVIPNFSCFTSVGTQSGEFQPTHNASYQSPR